MSWDTPTVPSEERSDMFYKLRALTGHPARVILYSGDDTDAQCKVTGILERIVVTGAIIDLAAPVQSLQAKTPVHIEVLAKHALCHFDSTISHTDNGRRLYVHLPETMETMQRRRYPRADVQLQSDMALHRGERPIPVQVVNLSTGGAAYSTPVAQEVGATVFLQLTALGIAPAEIPVKVVRCTPVDDALWVVGVAFERLNPAQEARIAHYVSTVLNDA